MERVHITYLLIFLLVILAFLVAGVFSSGIRNASREKSDRLAKRRNEAQVISDREKAFQDKYGQRRP